MRLVHKFNNYKENDRLLQLCKVSNGLYNQALHKFIKTLNIMRKVVGESRLMAEIVNSGWPFHPRKLNNLYCLGS